MKRTPVKSSRRKLAQSSRYQHQESLQPESAPQAFQPAVPPVLGTTAASQFVSDDENNIFDDEDSVVLPEDVSRVITSQHRSQPLKSMPHSNVRFKSRQTSVADLIQKAVQQYMRDIAVAKPEPSTPKATPTLSSSQAERNKFKHECSPATLPVADAIISQPTTSRYNTNPAFKELKSASNYKAWLKQLTVHCHRRGISEALTDESSSFQKELLGDVTLTCSGDVIEAHLLYCNTGFEALEALAKAFGDSSLQRHELLRELRDISSSKFSTPATYVDQFEQLVGKMNAIKVSLDEADLCTILVAGLDKRHYNFHQCRLYYFDDANFDLQRLKRQVRRLEPIRKPAALATGIATSSSSFKAKDSKSKDGRKPRRPCQFCQGDHWDRLCPQKMNQRKKVPISKDPPEDQQSKALMSATNKGLLSDWYLDSGASVHIANDLSALSSVSSIAPKTINTGRGPVTCSLVGTLLLEFQSGTLTVTNVHFVKGFTYNLLSMRSLCVAGAVVHFTNDKSSVTLGGVTIDVEPTEANLYRIVGTVVPPLSPALMALAAQAVPYSLWHERLGHFNRDIIQRTVEPYADCSITSKASMSCVSCQLAKTPRLHFASSNSPPPTAPLQLVSMDVRGPYAVPAEFLGALYKYDLKIIDHFSNFAAVYLIERPTKDIVMGHVASFLKVATTATGCKPVTLRCDGGHEFINSDLFALQQELGVTIQCTTPETPEQNGRVERLNRTLGDSMQSMLNTSNLSDEYWGYALYTANYVRNMLVTPTQPVSPYKLFFKRDPPLAHLRVFGCEAIVHIPQRSSITKPGNKNFKCIMLGYGDDSIDGVCHKAYRLLDPVTRKIHYSRSVIFNESVFPGDAESRGCITNFTSLAAATPPRSQLPDVSDSSSTHSSLLPTKVASRFSYVPADAVTVRDGLLGGSVSAEHILTTSRRRQPIYAGIAALLTQATTDIDELISPDPRNPTEARNSARALSWIKAEQVELDGLYSNNTFTLVSPSTVPKDVKLVGSRMLYKTKYLADGSVDKYKCRLVAQGFTQREGVDYTDTYAPTLRAKTMKIALAIMTTRKMHSRQLDVSTAFLYPQLKETIYMRQPKGLECPSNPGHVFKLQKCIYGLKQSGFEWNALLTSYLITLGFSPGTIATDECIFSRWTNGKLTLLTVYVDDITLLADKSEDLDEVISAMKKRFKMTDGPLNWILGNSITQQNGKTFIAQGQYVRNLLTKFHMSDCITARTPMNKSYDDHTESALFKDIPLFRSMVGSILYLATQTRPDIGFAICKIARRSNNPRDKDFAALKRIIQYLKGTMNYALVFYSKPLKLEGYSDADFGEDLQSRKSTTGCIYTLAGTAISWYGKLQSLVTDSSTESELVAAHFSANEGVWIQRLLSDLMLLPQNEPISLHIDNLSTIKIITGSKQSRRTKHIDIKYHKLRDLIQSNSLVVQHIPTEHNVADLMTKPLAGPRIAYLCNAINLVRQDCEGVLDTGSMSIKEQS